MSNTLVSSSTNLVTYTIEIDGSKIPEQFQALSIHVRKEINKIGTARVKLFDGGYRGLSEDFPAADSGKFDPGKTIKIKVGYESKEQVVFEGIIVKQGIKLSEHNCALIVECKEDAIKMTATRNNEVFLDKKDSDIIKTLIGKAGLQSTVEATDVQHKEVVQYYCSDWDFIMTRADLNGMVVITDGKKVRVAKPKISESSVLVVENGTSLFSIDAEVDARFQYSKVSSTGWDITNQKVVKSNSKSVDDVKIGITSSKLSTVLGASEYHLQSPANLQANMLEAWATGKLTRSHLSKLQGTVTFIGSEKVKPGVTITLKGLSNTFNGDVYVSSVEHIVEEGEWKTEAGLGIPFKSYSEEMPDIEAPAASGMLPGIKGLQTAIVKKIDSDPDGQHRVQISYPVIEKDNMGVWARLATFYATKESGAFFIPEVNDEVVVGFINDDPQQPIIIGSVYSSKNTPPLTADEKNKVKSLVTKSKMMISFDEEKKIITIETPAKNSVVLDDDQGAIVLTDKNNNKVELTKDGMTFTCAKDFTIKAQGKIIMEAQADIQAKATGSFKGEGMSVEMKGSTKFAAEGAQVEVKGSAQTVIKGGLVMIN